MVTIKPPLFVIGVVLLALVGGTHAQTIELIKMPLAELQAKASSGDPQALVQLGIRHNLGIGVPQSVERMKEYVGKAADAGNATAIGIRAMNVWGGEDFTLAFQSFEKGAQQGDLTAIRNLGRCYAQGLGCLEDKAKAFSLFTKAADSGDPAALDMLGLAYFNATGTEKNPTKGIELMEAAAAAGNAISMNTLAGFYSRGASGVTKNPAKAREYYRKAGEMGLGFAFENLLQTYTSLADTQFNGSTNGSAKDPDAARQTLAAGIQEGRSLLLQHPENVSLRFALGRIIEEAGIKASPRTDQAASLEAVTLCEGTVQSQPDIISDFQLGLYFRWIGRLAPSTDDTKAQPSQTTIFRPETYRPILERARQLAGRCKDSESLMEWCSLMLKLAVVYRDEKAPTKAIELAEQIVGLASPLLEKESWNFFVRTNLAAAQLFMARLHRTLEDRTLEFKASIAWLRVFGVSHLGIDAKGLLAEGLEYSDAHLSKARLILPVEGEKSKLSKYFNVPCVVNDALVPVEIYISDGLTLTHECRAFIDQVKWLKEKRGVVVPEDVVESIRKLAAIAAEQKVSFVELCTYALNYDEDGKSKTAPQKPDEKASPSSPPADTPKTAETKQATKWKSGPQPKQLVDGLKYLKGDGVEKDPAKAVELLTEAADVGSLEALVELATCYMNGTGCLKDVGNAIDLYTKAADGGLPAGLRELGNCYRNANGVEKDIEKAHELWTKAGELGDGKSLLNLGDDVVNEVGFEKTAAKLIEYRTKAGEAGEPKAYSYLGAAYENGTIVEKDTAKALELYIKAGHAGHARGFRSAGHMHYKGIGTEKNFAEANKYYEMAAEAGDVEAWLDLAAAFQNGEGKPKDLTQAVELSEKAGKLGSALAYRNLGVLFHNGKGVEKNLSKANGYYQKAVDLGDTASLRYLAYNHANGVGTTKDAQKAETCYLKAASLGDGLAYFHLAEAYRQGTWVAKDEIKAFALYQKGAELKDPGSELMVGWCLDTGTGVSKDQAKANIHYLKAAELGNTDGMHNIGVNLRDGNAIAKDLPKAVEWLQKSADGGNEWGMWNLGKCYASGRGVKKDMAKAVALFIQASEKSHAAATFDLGSCYENGLGVKKDKAKARELYEKAAKLGNTDAQQRLKDLTLSKQAKASIELFDRAKDLMKEPATERIGLAMLTEAAEAGLPRAELTLAMNLAFAKDFPAAIRWYRLAAEHGEVDAQTILAGRLEEGNGVTKDLNEAARWWIAAATAGDALAQYKAGRCFEEGNGVPASMEKAYTWYRKGAEAGNLDAAYSAAICELKGYGTEINADQSIKRLRTIAQSTKTLGQHRIVDAKYVLAQIYEVGIGGKPDRSEAGKWYFLAGKDAEERSVWGQVVRGMIDRDSTDASLKSKLANDNVSFQADNKTRALECYQKAAALGNDDANSRLKQGVDELFPKNSAAMPKQNTVLLQADVLFGEAREALDEKGDLSAALKKAQEGLLLLDENNEAHIAQWAHAHATIAGALVELAYVAEDSQKNDLCRSAMGQAAKGLLTGRTMESQLNSEWPDLVCRLLEERSRAAVYLAFDKELSAADTRKLWDGALADYEMGLSIAKKPLVKARLYMARSHGWLMMGAKAKETGHYRTGLKDGAEALRITKDTGDKDWIARAECYHGLALMLLTVSTGGGGLFDSDRIAAKDELQFAADRLQDSFPDAPFTLRALKWREAIVNYSDKVVMGSVIGAVGVIFNTPDSAATTEWNNRLRTMSGANSIARSSGSPIPYPGIP